MKIFFIIIIVIIVTIFSVQNSGVVTFSLFNYSFQSSLALLVIISFLLGLLIGLIYMTPSIIRKNMEISKLMEQKKGNNEPDR